MPKLRLKPGQHHYTTVDGVQVRHEGGDIVELSAGQVIAFADKFEDPVIHEEAAQRAQQLHQEQSNEVAEKRKAREQAAEDERARRAALSGKEPESNADPESDEDEDEGDEDEAPKAPPVVGGIRRG